ncbi:MAG: anthranilate synthase component I [gamma proteobacterium symbiont of Bathyaustriella thionipta]|nr:anthranilate synthase component I [gamma proteobacterium symbiont of Bathyaustriella thionipta]MCU7948920.1 anthranilate synthase component I [gamma proteobacterium symbiont of Bathyaustriella thionipta]MCU7954309.1 anthranilate synthase component I [gamma proteobacterium symbiont of Bathyaustriella thionipta]MCU7955627.1 anthranilate synthase component I [gamma proteobacterium symbiont of Bathyaustriella thionipta]MCU7966639.1 anthranilate synthase component I [gamma proteobacterium symbion
MSIVTKEQFIKLASEGYNRIPVVHEILVDLDTPLSAYLKLAEGAYSYLLESVHGGEKWGRYSIIGLPCQTIIKVDNEQIQIINDGQLQEELTHSDPLSWIEQYQQRYSIPEHLAEQSNLPRFTGGLVGYFGYETIGYIEPRLKNTTKDDPLGTPDILLMVSEEVLVFDNLSGKLYLIVHAHLDDKHQDVEQAWQSAVGRLQELATRLRQSDTAYKAHTEVTKVKEEDFVSGFTQDGFEQAVARIKDYIVEGDAMQVVISQRLSIPFKAPPLDLYRALRSLNPSPYMYFLNLGDFHIVGSSPEILTRVEEGKITVRPIAGTRPRGQTDEQDRQLEQDLLSDPKELAEHLMLIDLGRNDAGRVSEIGTVKLTDKMIVERYSHVMHIVSNVEGELNKKMSTMDALKATFPAGTVSGAPKIRAMEIIDELEPVKRGIYSGAIGYISWSGNMDTAIAIRTAVIKDKQLHIQAGAGIVADSVPRNEWDETMNKGRGVFRAVAMAECGLDSNANGQCMEEK